MIKYPYNVSTLYTAFLCTATTIYFISKFVSTLFHVIFALNSLLLFRKLRKEHLYYISLIFAFVFLSLRFQRTTFLVGFDIPSSTSVLMNLICSAHLYKLTLPAHTLSLSWPFLLRFLLSGIMTASSHWHLVHHRWSWQQALELSACMHHTALLWSFLGFSLSLVLDNFRIMYKSMLFFIFTLLGFCWDF